MKYYALMLCILIFVVFILQITIPGFTETFVLSNGRYWTLIASIFLHGDITHLLSNLFALGFFGTIFESQFGGKKFFTIFFAGGLISSFVSSFFYSSSLGASGAIFAIIGVLAVAMPRMVVWNLGVPMPMIVAAITWLLLDIAGAFFPSNIANMAHIAGIVFGAVVGLFWRKSEEKEKRSKPLSDREINEWEEEWMGEN